MFKSYVSASLMTLSGLALNCISGPLAAQENYVTHPGALYPPGCATLVEFDPDGVRGEVEVFSEGLLSLKDLSDGKNSSVELRFHRQGCAESGRSVIWVEMRVLTGGSAVVPIVQATKNGKFYPMRLALDPNSFNDLYTGAVIFQGETWRFFLEGPALGDWLEFKEDGLPLPTPELYNSGFNLQVIDFVDFREAVIQIPAYENDLAPDGFAFTGRLSGNWVVKDVPDQGFLLAFEELPDGTNFVFLSWYTYDADGKVLWLTAGDTYEPGASEITLPIELVTNGVFLGDKPADRSLAGQATLSAVSCNHLELDYNLSSLGLGSGIIKLQRLFSLETAGYACRDQPAREATFGD